MVKRCAVVQSNNASCSCLQLLTNEDPSISPAIDLNGEVRSPGLGGRKILQFILRAFRHTRERPFDPRGVRRTIAAGYESGFGSRRRSSVFVDRWPRQTRIEGATVQSCVFES